MAAAESFLVKSRLADGFHTAGDKCIGSAERVHVFIFLILLLGSVQDSQGFRGKPRRSVSLILNERTMKTRRGHRSRSLHIRITFSAGVEVFFLYSKGNEGASRKRACVCLVARSRSAYTPTPFNLARVPRAIYQS